jgi:plasmid stabilization system protein ParE
LRECERKRSECHVVTTWILVASATSTTSLDAKAGRPNVDAADRWIGKLFDAFDAFGDTPGVGHKREDLTAYPVLFWPVGAYLVIYRATSQPVEIVAVTQGSRDIPAFLHHRFPQ